MSPMLVKFAATAAAGGAAIAARRAVELGWREVRGEEPPTLRGGEGDTQLRDLMLWTAIMTLAILVAKRLAGRATVRVLGE